MVAATENTYKDIQKISSDIKKYRITVLQIVPSLLKELLRSKLLIDTTSLRYIFCGGDNLDFQLKNEFFYDKHSVRLINLYGPSECTVNSTFHEVTRNNASQKENIIGKPIDNMNIFILDKHQYLMPSGFVGEICISGRGLFSGYIGSTAHDSFTIGKGILGSRFIYRTSDYGYFNIDRDLVFSGRSSRTVKINGVFVNLDQVEENINNFGNGCQSYAMKYDSINGPILAVGVYVSQEVKIRDIFGFLKKNSEPQNIPQIIIKLTSLEMKSSGKINREKIASLISEKEKGALILIKDSDSWIEKITKVWRRIFWYLDKFNIDSSFFDMGCNSLQAVQLVNHINETFNLNLNISFVSIYRTISSQAGYLSNVMNSKPESLLKLTINNFVKLKSGSENLNIFIFPPVSGLIFWYTELSKLLDKRFSVYVIQDPSIDQGINLFSSVEHMANIYYQALNNIQSDGRFFICGASFGATISLEIVKRLEEDNKKVDFLGFFDGWAIYPTILKDKNFFSNLMDRQMSRSMGKYGQLDDGTKDLIIKIQKTRMDFLFDYVPPIINNKCILYKAKDLLPEYKSINEQSNYWREYIPHIITKMVEGTHETMFEGENVNNLARLINLEIAHSQVLSEKLSEYSC